MLDAEKGVVKDKAVDRGSDEFENFHHDGREQSFEILNIVAVGDFVGNKAKERIESAFQE